MGRPVRKVAGHRILENSFLEFFGVVRKPRGGESSLPVDRFGQGIAEKITTGSFVCAPSRDRCCVGDMIRDRLERQAREGE